MAKIYKYKVTLTSGDTKEIECKYPPYRIDMDKKMFKDSYVFKIKEADFNIIISDVVGYELVSTIGEDTVEERCDRLSRYRGLITICFLLKELLGIMCVFALLAGFLLINVTISADILILSLSAVLLLYTVVRAIFINREITQEISEIRKEKRQ